MQDEGRDYAQKCIDKGKCSYLRIDLGKGWGEGISKLTWNFVKAVTLTTMMDAEIC